ncbi:MAG: stage V sporulation protein SpoVM [Clostridia bacterium]|nr:stage V sporulation protein SpoVM [Clostridia bacterium]
MQQKIYHRRADRICSGNDAFTICQFGFCKVGYLRRRSSACCFHSMKGVIIMKFIVIDNPKFWSPLLRCMFKIKREKQQ